MTAFLRDRRVLLGLALLTVLYLSAIPSRPEPRFADECGYWFAAQSLRETGALRLPHVQGAPPAVFYPPGTSALIAALAGLAPRGLYIPAYAGDLATALRLLSETRIRPIVLGTSAAASEQM